jgi:hypothetical protein
MAMVIAAHHTKYVKLAGRTPKPTDSLPKMLPEIKLNHGQALLLFSQLGFQGMVSESTFHEYVKSLRKLGVPFEFGKIGMPRRGQANYHYNHLMELVLTLTLRVYHVVPDVLLKQIIHYRKSLNRHYRQAFGQRCSGIGAPKRQDGVRSVHVAYFLICKSTFQVDGW